MNTYLMSEAELEIIRTAVERRMMDLRERLMESAILRKPETLRDEEMCKEIAILYKWSYVLARASWSEVQISTVADGEAQ